METIRGTVSDVQFTMPEGHTARYADNPISALSIKFKVGEHWAVAARNEAFPPLNVGGEVNASSGVLGVRSLHNRTVGTTWKSTEWSQLAVRSKR